MHYRNFDQIGQQHVWQHLIDICIQSGLFCKYWQDIDGNGGLGREKSKIK